MTRSRAHFEVYPDHAGLWRWRLRAANGRIVADSGEGYASLRNVRRAIAATVDAVDSADAVAVREVAP